MESLMVWCVMVRRDKSRGERAIEEEKGLSVRGFSASFAPVLVLDAVTHQYFPVPLPYWSNLTSCPHPHCRLYTTYRWGGTKEQQGELETLLRAVLTTLKATPCGGMWLRWQICSDLPPWHQVHQCSTGCESLLGMGRDQTKGSILLKAQLWHNWKKWNFEPGLKWGWRVCSWRRGFLIMSHFWCSGILVLVE